MIGMLCSSNTLQKENIQKYCLFGKIRQTKIKQGESENELDSALGDKALKIQKENVSSSFVSQWGQSALSSRAVNLIAVSQAGFPS